MKIVSYKISGIDYSIPTERFDAIVVGTGAAGYNAAHTLSVLGKKSVAIVTEGVYMGTSRNTGSDKQTYFKPSADAFTSDSAYEVAKALASGGCMHGDIALTEAVYANRCFYKLVALGVPFPHDRYGAYTGYKTDHDTIGGRATSCGPLTSKLMTEVLARACEKEGVPVFDGCRVIEILTENGCAFGVLALDGTVEFNAFGLRAFLADDIVYACGGPGGIYGDTVYPESQSCALGTAMSAGARAVNLTEWQYGIASVKFRWNLSGSYQQVLPRYVSVDENGCEYDFLDEYFSNAESQSRAIFLKGYEWPFDPSKIYSNGCRGSSSVDLAVFAEKQKNRRVYLDFRHNPHIIHNFDEIFKDAAEYLVKSGAEGDTPVKRLLQMNEGAYRLYLSHGIDLERDRLEISVCAQHCNGGLEGDIHYESTTLRHFFPAGEINGVFGVKRPGGSALNSTQVSSTAAAEKISATNAENNNNERSLSVSPKTERILANCTDASNSTNALNVREIVEKKHFAAARMSLACSFLRSRERISNALKQTKIDLTALSDIKAADTIALRELFIYKDVLTTEAAVMTSALDYIDAGGLSRGSFVVTDKDAEGLLRSETAVPTDTAGKGVIRSVSMTHEGEFSCGIESVRPIPRYESWFENVLAEFERGEIFR